MGIDDSELSGPKVTFDRRWRDRRVFSLDNKVLFDPSRFAVDVIPESMAKPFVIEHHYAGSFPAARISFGLFEGASSLKGVCVVSVPMNQMAVPKYLGLAPNDGAEIGRFVLDPVVAFNGESWFLARVMKLLKRERPDIRGLISYADPVERRDERGVLFKQAHWGSIYQASNARFVGRSAPRTLILAPDGTVISERSLSKIRQEERGAAYAARQFMDKGALERLPGEEASAWVTRALRQPTFRRVRHPGNFVYLFNLGRDVSIQMPAQAYPKQLAA